jgi:zinc transport system permease protein
MFDVLLLPFMQRALAGGLLVGLLASYYGPFIVQRRMAFLGNGLAHAAFGGVALGVLLNAEPIWVAMPFTVAVAMIMVWVRERGGLADDTVIGVFFALSMALGMVFIALREDYAGDAFRFLFGSILAVSTADLWASAVVLAITALLLPLWPRWAYATFDRRLAQADRLPVLRDDYVLSIMLALAIVVSIKVVGIILASAFFVLPAATARLMTNRFSRLTLVSVLLGEFAVTTGLWLSYLVNWPTGPVIVLVQGALFLAALATQGVFSRS